MSTYISFKDGTAVHVLDVCICGKISHKLVETGVVYERESSAIKRAILRHRKKMCRTTHVHHRRKKILHCRRIEISFPVIRPTIYSLDEAGKLVHYVVETGKSFKKIKNAIKNCMNYVKLHS